MPVLRPFKQKKCACDLRKQKNDAASLHASSNTSRSNQIVQHKPKQQIVNV